MPQQHPKCAGCSLYRNCIVPAHPSCKKTRICALIDGDVLYRLGKQVTLDQVDEIQRHLEAGAAAANLHIQGLRFPATAESFTSFLLELHRKHWTLAFPSIAGRFRNENEIGEVGTGQNRITGTPSEHIHSQLTLLFEKTASAGFDGADLSNMARSCAMFLERFFRIHPFADGNGRIGRLMVTLACQSTGLAQMLSWDFSRKSRKQYLDSLAYAHRNVGKDQSPGGKVRVNPYKRLARWLGRHILHIPAEIGMEAEPPPWDESPGSLPLKT